jgi:hypothetical protein
MNTSVLKTTLLSVLLLVPQGAVVRASDPPDPPRPAAAPEAPVLPAPPEAPRKRTKRIVVTSPDKEIFVDGDHVFIGRDGDDADILADLDMFGEDGDHPTFLRMHGPSGGGFIGVRPIEMTPELRQHFGAPRDAGILVGSLEPEGPAAKAGLQVGDIVTKVDGDTIESTRELVRAVRHKKGGETITVEVVRNRAAKSLTVTVSERKEKEFQVGEMSGMFPRHGWNWKTPGPGHPMAAPLPPGDSYPELEQRLEDLEKKLKALEGRLPSH